MDRRTLLLLPALLLPGRTHAQPTDRLPPDAPGSAPRDDASFSRELLDGMAQGEAVAMGRMARFADIRTLRRQVPIAAYAATESYFIQAMAVERRWSDAGITRPGGRAPYLPPAGYAKGPLVFAYVFAHTTRAEKGLLPYSILTNLRDA